MAVWSAFLAILLFPGKFLVARLPKMDDDPTRLAFNMINYIFWLTPTVGVLIWLVIRHALAQV